MVSYLWCVFRSFNCCSGLIVSGTCAARCQRTLKAFLCCLYTGSGCRNTSSSDCHSCCWEMLTPHLSIYFTRHYINWYFYWSYTICHTQHFLTFTMTVLYSRGHQELQTVSAAIQTVLSTPVSVASALKGIQKTLGKALPFKVWKDSISFNNCADMYSSSLVIFPKLWYLLSEYGCPTKQKKVKPVWFIWNHYFTNHIHFLIQLESVAECASQLRLLSKALDVSELRLDSTTGSWRQELVRLQGAGLRLDIKESLLEAWGLVLLANNQLDPQKSGELVSHNNLFNHLIM